MQENRQRYKFQYWGDHDRVTAVVEQKDRQLLHRYARKHRTCVSKIVQELIQNFVREIREEEAPGTKRVVFEMRKEAEFKKLAASMLTYQCRAAVEEETFDFLDFGNKGYAVIQYSSPSKQKIKAGLVSSIGTEERIEYGNTTSTEFLHFLDPFFATIAQKEGTSVIYF
jgi:hypothetical protein